MRRLIINADDFGLATEINQGIILGHKEGLITSTSIMCSAPCFEEAVELAKSCPGLGVGVHLTLVGGVRSLASKAEVPSLLDAEGRFLDNYVCFAKRFYTGGINKLELEKELRLQLERALSSGLRITHLDSHQHLHVLPGVAGLVQRLGEEYGIKKMRIPQEDYFFKGGFSSGLGRLFGRNGLTLCAQLAAHGASVKGFRYPEHFFGMLAGGNLNVDLVANVLKKLPEGTSELMTHPGLSSEKLGKRFPWHYHWEEELAAYLDINNKRLVKNQNITLINFGDI